MSSVKGSLFYSLDQKIPLYVGNRSKKLIDSSFKYIPTPTEEGLMLISNISLLSSIYENGNYQGYLGFGIGPELIHGNFKNRFLDYTRIRLWPSYKIKTGDSLFKFDQIADLFTVELALDQQLYGPLLLSTEATLNLDSGSNDYGNFTNSRVALDWKKRSYKFGIFYQPINQSGGIAFSLFGFK